MAIASPKMTLEEYLTYDDGTDTWYELVQGELIVMPPESDLNRRIASLLFVYFLHQGIPSYRLTMKTEIVIGSTYATTRFPDVMVLSEELATALEGARRSTIMPDMPPPLLVVEVVSPGQEKRDYRDKRTEYAAQGIGEYWIVDPIQEKVTVLEWVEGLYEKQAYEGDRLTAIWSSAPYPSGDFSGSIGVKGAKPPASAEFLHINILVHRFYIGLVVDYQSV